MAKYFKPWVGLSPGITLTLVTPPFAPPRGAGLPTKGVDPHDQHLPTGVYFA